MYSQGSYDAQSGQGPQAPRPSPHLQHFPALQPPLPRNFQQGPLLPLPQVPPRPGQPGVHIYQQGLLPPHAVRQAPPGALPSPGQPYLPPPPAIRGSTPLTNVYGAAKQNPQHSYLAPGVLRGSQAPLPPRNLPPPPSHSQTLYKAPTHQLPEQPPLPQGPQQIPPPPHQIPASNFKISTVSVRTLEATVLNSQMSSMASALPPPPPLPPPPTSTPPPAPPLISHVSSPASSIPLPSGSQFPCHPDKPSSPHSHYKSASPSYANPPSGGEHNIPAGTFSVDHSSHFLEGGSCSGLASLGGEGLTSKRNVASDVPCPPPKPVEEMEPALPSSHPTVAAELHSPSDSDMEMEDDITAFYNGHEVNQPIEGLITDPVNSKLDAAKQLSVVQSLAGSEAATEYLFSSDRMNSYAFSANDASSSKVPAVAECLKSDNFSGQEIKGSSPFRLLQDYDSNNSSENDKDPCPKDADCETFSLLHENSGNLKMDADSKNPCKTEREFGQVSESGTLYRASEFASVAQGEVKETVPISISSGLTTELVITECKNQQSFKHDGSSKELLKEDVTEGRGAKVAVRRKDGKESEDKSASNTQKIDKFGRLVREGASDSDSDDSRHDRRRTKRGRSRSWSRSQSPLDRSRRRRRSRSRPRRRREKRSRSRSWSPRKRRSRSGSPSFRHTSEISNGIKGREKGQMKECFDFLRGRCYRGASCRYVHHDSEKSDGLNHHRSRRRSEQFQHSSKNCEDGLKSSLNHEQEMRDNHDTSAEGRCSTKDNDVFHDRENPIMTKFDSFREYGTIVPETNLVKGNSDDGANVVDRSFGEAMKLDKPTIDSFPVKPATVANCLKSVGEASQNVLSSLEDSLILKSHCIISDPVVQDVDNAAQHSDDSSISDLSPNKTSTASPEKLHASETLPNSAGSLQSPAQMPLLPHSAPKAEGSYALHAKELSGDYNLIAKTTELQSQSASLESLPSYMLPNQSSLFPVPSNSSSLSLPPPPPQFPVHGPTGNLGTTQQGVTQQFQQSYFPSRSDFGSQIFSGPHLTKLFSNPQISSFQRQACPPVQEPQQRSLQVDDLRLKPPPGCNPSGQQFVGTNPFVEEQLKQLPMHPLSVPGSISRSNSYPQPMSFPQDVSATKIPSCSGANLHPREILKPPSQIHPYSQQQQWPPYGLHHSVTDTVYGLPGKITSSRYLPDIQDMNQPSHLPEFGVPKSTHFNPYASTFEKTLSSRFSSDAFRKEKDTTYGSKHDNGSVDGIGAGSRQSTSLTSARGFMKINPMSGGDQYDPLFDSIEPSSNSYKKSDCIQQWEPSGDSAVLLRQGSNQMLDVEENNKKKEVGGIALATSLDNEEFGETADEVGDVENGSQSNPNDLENANGGEVEIDQMKSPSRSKESRSMKLFKACLADFVKEVLKPSWRQGNMSKETFKTVVKKTVDKVSGAMKSHQMPKSKAKINQYIDSSQRKLTKLVMGYVDKYAKG